MKILVVGGGGREHALCSALRRSRSTNDLQLYCSPGNAGIAEMARCLTWGATDVEGLADFAASEKIDLTIVGGEASLAAGLVDEFSARSLRAVGPDRRAARLEASKIFAKSFMTRHHIPTARWRAARGASEARDILRGGEFGGADAPVVIKADGLAAGKGVVVARHQREAEEAVNELGGGGEGAPQPLLIEEALAGREASLLLFADGRNYSLMPAARDHKRIGENDTGPNTGGMGAVTAPEVIDEATLARVKREIVEPTLDGARAENIPFRGVLFIGLMLTADGPRVLEYNVRFGDPEAQAITVRLQSDLVEICESIVEGTLDRTTVRWSHDASACVVLAAPGYPASPVTGSLITGLERVRADHPQVHVFHGGTARGADGSWVTAGGRVLGVTATGPTLEQALSSCYTAVGEINWEGMQYRRDIGKFAR